MVRVDWRVSCRLVGTILKWLWVPLLLPLGIALYDGTALIPFVLPMVGTVVLGVGLSERNEASRMMFGTIAERISQEATSNVATVRESYEPIADEDGYDVAAVGRIASE